jgi:hypothetical protein
LPAFPPIGVVGGEHVLPGGFGGSGLCLVLYPFIV